MKKLLFIGSFITLLFSQTAKAQLSHPHFLSANFGTNIPLSDYKSADSLASGSANNGLYYSFEAGAFFTRILGFGVNIGAFSNALNDEDIKDQLKRDFTNSNGKFEVSSENWSNGYIMLGPYLSFGTKKFIVDLKLLAGVVNTEKPLINIKSNENSTSSSVQSIKASEVSNTSFGVNYGIHFRIKLKSKLALRINAEGIMSTQEFENKIQETDFNGNVSVRNDKVEKEIQALNLGLGLVINL